MEEFKKQYEKMIKRVEWPPKDAYDLHFSHKLLWRAALEQVRSWCFPFSDTDEVVKRIEKELEENQNKVCIAPEFRMHVGCKTCLQKNCEVREI